MPDALRREVCMLRRRPGRVVHEGGGGWLPRGGQRAVVAAIRRVREQLDRLDDPTSSAAERADAERRLLEEVDILWRTGQLRATQPKPLDEVRSVTSVFDETLFRTVPEVYRALDRALDARGSGARPPLAPPFLRFGSSVGGYRDGNPFVTARVTAGALLVQAEHALIALGNATTRIGRSPTADAAPTPASPALRRRLAALRKADPKAMAELEIRSPSESHRQFLLHVADRLQATRRGIAGAYRSAAELTHDLRLVQDSLAAAGALRLAFGEVQHLVWQAGTFGLHLAAPEGRQPRAPLS